MSAIDVSLAAPGLARHRGGLSQVYVNQFPDSTAGDCDELNPLIMSLIPAALPRRTFTARPLELRRASRYAVAVPFNHPPAPGLPRALAYTGGHATPRPRHLGRRTVAYLIDAFLSTLVLCVNFVVIGAVALTSDDFERLTPGGAIVIGLSFLLTSVVAFGYLLVRDALPGGASLGKQLMGLRVLDVTTGASCSFRQSFVRNLILLALGAIDLIVPLFRPDGRRVGDDVAKTIVVRR